MSENYCCIDDVATLILIILVSIFGASILSITITYFCMKRKWNVLSNNHRYEQHTTVVCNRKEDNDLNIKMPSSRDDSPATSPDQCMNTVQYVPKVACSAHNHQAFLPGPRLTSDESKPTHEEPIFESVNVYDRPEGQSIKKQRRRVVKNSEAYDDVEIRSFGFRLEKDLNACTPARNLALPQQIHVFPKTEQPLNNSCYNISMPCLHVYDTELPTLSEIKKSKPDE